MFNLTAGISEGDSSKTAVLEDHNEILRTNIDKITENLSSIERVLNMLMARKAITPQEREDVLTFPASYKQNTELVMLLLKKPKAAFDVFFEALQETNQEHVLC